jgi:hypothetical protein
MPKRVIDEKTGIAETAKEKAARVRDQEGAGRDYDDEDEITGIDEDLANPELERSDDEDEDDIKPPPLDDEPSRF